MEEDKNQKLSSHKQASMWMFERLAPEVLHMQLLQIHQDITALFLSPLHSLLVSSPTVLHRYIPRYKKKF